MTEVGYSYTGWKFSYLLTVFYWFSQGLRDNPSKMTNTNVFPRFLGLLVTWICCHFFFPLLWSLAWTLKVDFWILFVVGSWGSSSTLLPRLFTRQQRRTSVHDALPLRLRAACAFRGTDERAHLPGGPRVQPRLPAMKIFLILY